MTMSSQSKLSTESLGTAARETRRRTRSSGTDPAREEDNCEFGVELPVPVVLYEVAAEIQ